jgi:hypothetical protein
MSTQYNGIAKNIPFPGTVNIFSSTNTTPIVITTSSAHGLTTGDRVTINGHLGNTHANGDWNSITYISPTTFSLDSSAGNGVGGASGVVQPITFGSTYAIPSDGDPDSGNTFDVGDEALGDRSAALLYGVGAYKLVAYSTLGLSIGGTTQGFVVADSIPPVNWATNSGHGSGLAQMVDPGSTTPINWIISGLTANDIVEVTLDTTCQVLGTSVAVYTGSFAIGTKFIPWIGGGGLTATFTPQFFSPAQYFTTQGSSEVDFSPLSLRALLLVPTYSDGSLSGMLYIGPFANPNGSASQTVNLRGDRLFAYKVWRPTYMPQ